jgi:cytochrome c-type biogenesis protein CcmH
MKTFRILFFFVLLSLGMAVLATGTAQAQDPTPRPVTANEVNAIAKQLYCPVCENIPLDVCGTTACEQWRQKIRDLLVEGKNEAEIKAYFVEYYGDRVLAAPPARGFNWLVYVVPVIAILAGALILFRVFKNWHKPLPAGKAQMPASIPDDEYVRRLEEDLRKQ